MKLKQFFVVLNVLLRLVDVETCKSKTYNAKLVQEEEDNSVNFVNLHLGTAKWMGAAVLAIVIALGAYYFYQTYRQRNRERRRDGLPTRWLPPHLGSMRARRGSAPARHHSPHHSPAQELGMEQYRPRQQSE